MHAQISRAYHGWKTPFHYWKFHCPWQTCAQEDDGSVFIYQGRCHFHYCPSLGDAYRVVPTSPKDRRLEMPGLQRSTSMGHVYENNKVRNKTHLVW